MKKLYPHFRRTWAFVNFYQKHLTFQGRLIIISIPTFLIFGGNTDRTIFYYLFSISLALITISFISTIRQTFKIELKREISPFIAVGKTLHYQVTLTNKSKKPSDNLYFTEIAEDPRPTLKELLNTPEENEEKRNKFDRKLGYYRWKWLTNLKQNFTPNEFIVPKLMPDETKKITVNINPNHRGIIALQGYRIYTKDIFGIVKSGKTVNLPQRITVFPEIKEIEIPEIKFTYSDNQSDTENIGTVNTSTDFHALREYIPGDLPKSISWKTYARTDKLYTIDYKAESESGFSLFVDIYSPLYFSEDIEKSISYAASFIVKAKKEGLRLDTIFTALETISGREEDFEILRKFAAIIPENDELLEKNVQFIIKNSIDTKGIIVILSKNDPIRNHFTEKLKESGLNVKTLVAE